jgi:hypothetical protein
MTTNAIRSGGSTEPDARMKTDPDYIREFLKALEDGPPARYGVIPRTIQRYRNGHIPELLATLIENPELAWAIVRDAERLRARRETDRE